MRDQEIEIKLAERKIHSTAAVLIIANCFFLVGTWVCNSIDWSKQSFLISFVLRESNLAWENTTGTWYSSMLLGTIGIQAGLCFARDKNLTSTPFASFINYGWIVISSIFILLSLDEIGSIHESIGNTNLFQRLGIHEALLSNTFYGLILVVALFMAAFGFSKFRNTKPAMMFGLVGILFFLSIPLNERFEWSQVPANIDLSQYTRNPNYIVLEEGLELFGSLSFLFCLWSYLSVKDQRPASTAQKKIQINYTIQKKHLFRGLAMTLIIFSVLNFFLLPQFAGVEKFDNGIPENWFPSVTAFLSFVIYFYLGKDQVSIINVPNLVGVLALVISAYFGSNMYTRIYQNTGSFFAFPNIILASATFFIGLILLLKSSSKLIQLGIAVWIFGCCIGLLVHSEYTTGICFISFSILNLSFFGNDESAKTDASRQSAVNA